MHLNEFGWPSPHVITRLQTENSRDNRAHDKSISRQPHWQLQTGVRFAARFAPSRDHMVSEFFKRVTLRKKSPGPVMSVLVKNCATVLAKNIRDLLHQKFRI